MHVRHYRKRFNLFGFWSILACLTVLLFTNIFEASPVNANVPATPAAPATSIKSNLAVYPPQQTSGNPRPIKSDKFTETISKNVSSYNKRVKDSLPSIQSIQKQKRRLKRKQFLIIFLLRVAFVVLLPISVVTAAISLAITLLFLGLRILTLNFTNRDTYQISSIVFRSNLSLIVASITGILNPIFATFGVIAAMSASAIEITEPLLRIKYQREIKRLRHLHRLLTDPVLMETMGMLVKGAKSMSAITAAKSKKDMLSIANKSSDVLSMSIESSRDLVDIMIKSSGAQDFVQRVELNGNIPPQVLLWAQEQYKSLRKSGVLEEAAKLAVGALSKELEGIARFLPYLEAIELVRKKEEDDQKKRQKQTEKEKKRFFQ